MSSSARRVLALVLVVGLGGVASTPAQPPPAPQPVGPPPKPPTSVAGKVEREAPHAAERHVRRGNEALLDGRAGEARKAYAQAQVLAPDVPEIQYDLGTAALVDGDLPAAERALLTLDRGTAAPGEPPPRAVDDARFNLGHVALAQGDLPGAIQQLARVVASNPDAPDARRNLELALRLLQQEQQQQEQQQQQQQQDQQEQEQQNQENENQEEPSGGQQPQPQGEGDQEQPAQPQPREGQQEPRPGEPQPRPGGLSREKAEQLLEMTAEEEQRALEQEQQKRRAKARSAPAGKDW